MKSALLFLPALALVAGCGRPHSAGTAADPAASLPPAKVRAGTVRAETIAATATLTGTVRPVQRAQLAAKVMGTIEEMPVVLGQVVRAGDLLVKISAGEISARVAQAQSQLNVARRDLARERDLLGKGASTADLVRGLEDRVALTEAQVREAEVMLGYATLRAPFAGVIARKHSQAGDLAAPGQPLLELEGGDAFQIEVPVPDSFAAPLSPGASLQVEIPATSRAFAATVAELSPAADPNARSVLAKLAVPAGTSVRSGQFARVQVSGPSLRVVLVPAAAVSPLGQMERVFVVGDQNRAVLRLVKSGARRGDRLEISSGLADGDRVVLDPPATLREGQSLEVQP